MAPSGSSTLARLILRALASDLPPARASVIMRAGPIGVRFEFASEELAAAYARSFAVTEPAGQARPPELTLRVLCPRDLDLTALIPVPADRGRAFGDGALFSLWHPDRRSVLHLLDRSRGFGITWLADAQPPDWELSRPACPPIHAFLEATPWTTVHGGAVGRDGRMLMLAGRGGAGKTTAALACALAGWDYAGDDYILVDSEAGIVAPLYASARLRPDVADAFPGALVTAARSDAEVSDPRHELRLRDCLPAARFRGGSLAAVLLPRRLGAGRPSFSAARRVDALEALFKSTMLGSPGALDATARKLTRLVSQAPAFFVDTGSDPAAIPEAFATFLSRL